MGQAIIRKLRDETLEDFRAQARENGTSLEAELRELIESHRPLRKKSPAELRRMSDEALAMTPPHGPEGSDSTLLIRWDRDTNHGKWLDDGWTGTGWNEP
jgi:plasmid stability protein